MNQCDACGERKSDVTYSQHYNAYLCEECEETARRMDVERDE